MQVPVVSFLVRLCCCIYTSFPIFWGAVFTLFIRCILIFQDMSCAEVVTRKFIVCTCAMTVQTKLALGRWARFSYVNMNFGLSLSHHWSLKKKTFLSDNTKTLPWNKSEWISITVFTNISESLRAKRLLPGCPLIISRWSLKRDEETCPFLSLCSFSLVYKFMLHLLPKFVKLAGMITCNPIKIHSSIRAFFFNVATREHKNKGVDPEADFNQYSPPNQAPKNLTVARNCHGGWIF